MCRALRRRCYQAVDGDVAGLLLHVDAATVRRLDVRSADQPESSAESGPERSAELRQHLGQHLGHVAGAVIGQGGLNGGVFGALVGGVAIGRFGSRISMLAMSAAAIAGAGLLSVIDITPANLTQLLVLLTLTGA